MALPSTSYQPTSSHPPPGRALHPNLPKHKRGGQPGNQNARKAGTFSALHPGPLSPTRLLAQEIKKRLQDPASPLDQIVAQAFTARQALLLSSSASPDEFLPVFRLLIKMSKITTRAFKYCIPPQRLSNALASIARDPFGWFERAYKDYGITRDTDSFFPVSEKSAQYSPLPPGYPRLATNLTDSQWAVLAPLIPPDPHLDWLIGEPTVIIAANRWGFTQYYFTGEFNDFVIMQEYHRVLQRFPALYSGSPHLPSANRKGRGRPRTSPRALLDAIFWKLATGQPWHALPSGFPPLALCRKYYRRLFLSGRLYTLLLALYNHMRLEASIDLTALMEAGVFTTTPSQKIALSPKAPPTWENYTALLFMQLARSAYSRQERQHKQSNPFYPLLSDFKGTSALSTGELPGGAANHPASSEAAEPGISSPLSESDHAPEVSELEFQPLETSSAWKKWSKIERDQKIIAHEVSKRLRPGFTSAVDIGGRNDLGTAEDKDSEDSISSFLDDYLEP